MWGGLINTLIFPEDVANVIQSFYLMNEVADRFEELVSEQSTTIVVRCKSCKFSKWIEKNGQRYCTRKWVMYRVKERDYCSYGIRKA